MDQSTSNEAQLRSSMDQLTSNNAQSRSSMGQLISSTTESSSDENQHSSRRVGSAAGGGAHNGQWGCCGSWRTCSASRQRCWARVGDEEGQSWLRQRTCSLSLSGCPPRRRRQRASSKKVAAPHPPAGASRPFLYGDASSRPAARRPQARTPWAAASRTSTSMPTTSERAVRATGGEWVLSPWLAIACACCIRDKRD